MVIAGKSWVGKQAWGAWWIWIIPYSRENIRKNFWNFLILRIKYIYCRKLEKNIY
jgi:hypothetical protein